jgi:hypothetical protein
MDSNYLITTETMERKSHMQNSIQQKRPNHDDIAVMAYYVWEKKGRPVGQHVKCWLEAEQQLLQSCSKPRPRGTFKVSRSIQRLREEPAFAQAPGL